MRTPSKVVTEGGSELSLPPGVFFPQDDFDRLDAEMKRLQEAETRAAAERKVLLERARGGSGWVVGMALGVALGLAAGAFVF